MTSKPHSQVAFYFICTYYFIYFLCILGLLHDCILLRFANI